MVFLTPNCSDRGPRGPRGSDQRFTAGANGRGIKKKIIIIENINLDCVILEKSVRLIYCVWKKKRRLISHFHLSGFWLHEFGLFWGVFFVSRSHLDENKFHSHCVPICRPHPPCPPSRKHPWKKTKKKERKKNNKTIWTDLGRLTESALSMQLWYICDSSCV